MEYREHVPIPPLRRHVQCLWTLRAGADPAAPAERVLPDGCCELILNFADPFGGVRADGSLRVQPLVMMVGQIRRFLLIAPTGAVDLVGVRFHAGGLFPFFRSSQDEWTERRLDVGDLCPRFRRRLLDAGRDLGRLQSILLERLQPERPGLVEAAVRCIRAARGQVRMDELVASLGTGGRRLERHFRREVGLSPKLFARIVRFQGAVRALEAGRGARLAADAGYYDQAHLIRDFRHFAGQTPTEFLADEHELSDHLTALSDSSNRSQPGDG